MRDLPTIITRGEAPLKVAGIHACTLQALVGRLQEIAGPATILVSDVSLGAWQTNHAATELAAQWPKAAAELAFTASAGPDFPSSLADAIGTWIDTETKGERTTLQALATATKLVRQLSADASVLCAVLLPRFGLALERADELFLQFLAAGLATRRSRLVFVCTDQALPRLSSVWQVSWQRLPSSSPVSLKNTELALVPGVVPAHMPGVGQLAAGEPGCWRLGDVLVIPPECRQAPERASRFDFDRLALGTSVGWLRGYALAHGHNLYVDVHYLLQQGMQRVAEGGEEVGLRLIQHAQTCATTPVERAMLQAQWQGLCIATRRYADAAAAPDPAPNLPAALRGILLETKGWAMLLAGDAPRAEAHLRQAIELLEPTIQNTREDLYLQNIYALSLLRTGKKRAALEREHAIEKARQKLAINDCRLAYVNLINLARLYRIDGLPDQSARYYEQAFETTRGVRSESDCVYTNACLARIDEDRGRTEAAFAAWLRAALHFASSIAPEALGSRVVAMLLDRKPRHDENLVEVLSQKLFDHLTAAAERAGRRVPVPVAGENHPPRSPVFVRTGGDSEWLKNAEAQEAVGGPGWGAFLSRHVVPAAVCGGSFEKLRAALAALLQELCPGALINQSPTIVVDDQFGDEIPTTLAELINCSARIQVGRICYDGERIDLDATMLATLPDFAMLRLAPCVKSLSLAGDLKTVTYRRALQPRRLSEAEAGFLELLAETACLEDLCRRSGGRCTKAAFLDIARSLERDRIIIFDMTGNGPWAKAASSTAVASGGLAVG
jgi:tetratricopeptide (TPR) repeat protein